MADRREFLTMTGAAAVYAALPANVRAAYSTSGRKPNIILILTDDQGYSDLGCYGSTSIRTPNIDKMAQEGIRFTDFYDCASVCSPTRASIMTGCYPKRVGITDVIFPGDTVALNLNEITLAEILRSGAGYTTACFGKWHLGNTPDYFPPNQGFDYWYGLPYSNDMSPLSLYRNLTEIGPETAATQPTLSKRYTEEAVQFITNNAANPFFIYLAHSMPHIPIYASEAFAGTSSQGPYGDVCQELDWSAGQILQTLKNLNLEKDTIVVYTSDNGPWLGLSSDSGTTPFKGGKFSTDEGGFRAPCIVRWPGTIPAGTVCSEVAATMDFYATFCALAGIPLPIDRIIDSKSILPLITNETGAVSPHDAFLYYDQTGTCCAIRSGTWKYNSIAGTLYDLSTDPGEVTDVAGTNTALVASLSAMIQQRSAEISENARPAGNTAVAVTRKSKRYVPSKPLHRSERMVNLQGRIIDTGRPTERRSFLRYALKSRS
jgi:arylsulfatase A